MLLSLETDSGEPLTLPKSSYTSTKVHFVKVTDHEQSALRW